MGAVTEAWRTILADGDLSVADIDKIDGITNGTVAAGKAMVVDANKAVDVVRTASLRIGVSGSETTVDATGAELNRAADVSARSVAAGATESVVEATHEGRTILLDTAAGSVVTLPAPSIGARYRFIVSVMPTSNFHQVKVAAGTDFIAGIANILDVDAATQQAFRANGTSDDNIQLNGTTKGGQVGDWIDIEGISATQWALVAQLTCPAGSNPATPFSAAV